MDDTYLFIDGEYLRRIHREAMQDFFRLGGSLQVSTLMDQAQAARAYFYDCLDDAPLAGESEEDRQKRLAPANQFFDSVQSLSGFHVRLGSVTGQRKKRRQKEVDILVAVDMLSHGFNGSMKRAVLVAGDLDFRPIVEALVRHGVFVQVWYHRSSVARDLPGAADFGHEIRFRQLYEWNTKIFQDTHPLPLDSIQPTAIMRNGHLLKTGHIQGHPVQLYSSASLSSQSTAYSLWIETVHRQHQCALVYGEDLPLLERYVSTQYGPLTWSATSLRAESAGDRTNA
jgi:uncharacterized LabA/DUF88 family protein